MKPPTARETSKPTLAGPTVTLLEQLQTRNPAIMSLSQAVHYAAEIAIQYEAPLHPETKQLLEEIRDRIAFPMTTTQILHLALIALNQYDDPLQAPRGPPQQKKKP